MNIADKVKVKKQCEEMLAGMSGFSEIDLRKTMTIVDFEWPKVLVKENSKKWRVSWLELVKPEQKAEKSKSKTKKR